MAKSKAQEEKKKRATEKRKHTEKAVLKLAAAMPDEAPQGPSNSVKAPPKPTRDKP